MLETLVKSRASVLLLFKIKRSNKNGKCMAKIHRKAQNI